MILDDAERQERESLKARASGDTTSQHLDHDSNSVRHGQNGTGIPPWEREDLWGNDGLVTVQSARWGEFLGIIEGCDHWDLRGSRGSFSDLSVDIPSVVPSLPLTMEGWPFGDWSRLVSAWTKRDKALVGELRVSAAVAQSGLDAETSSPREMEEDRVRMNHGEDRDDPVVKASTDRLSVVFDWLVEQVPSPTIWSPSSNKTPERTPASKDIATKMDLERFFVALARKLYDEGL